MLTHIVEYPSFSCWKIVDDCPLDVIDSKKVYFICWIVNYIVCKQTYEMVTFWSSKTCVEAFHIPCDMVGNEPPAFILE